VTLTSVPSLAIVTELSGQHQVLRYVNWQLFLNPRLVRKGPRKHSDLVRLLHIEESTSRQGPI